jgi:hypothetical protein
VTPSETLEKIRRKFDGLGICHQDLTVDVSGVSFRISLDSESFVVYRVNHCRGDKHHMPGWPVCLVTRDAIFQECSDEELGTDHCSCGVSIEQWMEIVQDQSQEI